MFDAEVTDKVHYGEDYVSELKNRFKLAKQAARVYSEKYKEAYKERHDATAKPDRIAKDDLVLLHRPELAKLNRKIDSCWDGQYMVLNLVGQSNVLLQRRTFAANSFCESRKSQTLLCERGH